MFLILQLCVTVFLGRSERTSYFNVFVFVFFLILSSEVSDSRIGLVLPFLLVWPVTNQMKESNFISNLSSLFHHTISVSDPRIHIFDGMS